jgi:hypothetical protein
LLVVILPEIRFSADPFECWQRRRGALQLMHHFIKQQSFGR